MLLAMTAVLGGCSALLGDDSATTDGGGADSDAGGFADAAAGTIAIQPLPPLRIVAGRSRDFTVTVSRGAGVTGAITVTLGGLGNGVSGDAITIPDGTWSADVVLTTTPNAILGLHRLTVTATAGAATDSAELDVSLVRASGVPVATWGEGGDLATARGVESLFVTSTGLLRGVSSTRSEPQMTLYQFTLDSDGALTSESRLVPEPATGIVGVYATTPYGDDGVVVNFRHANYLDFSLRAFGASGAQVPNFGLTTEDFIEYTVAWGDAWLYARRGLDDGGYRTGRLTSLGAVDATWTDTPSPHPIFALAAREQDLYVGGWDGSERAYARYLGPDGALIRTLLDGGATAWGVTRLAATATGVVVVLTSDEPGAPAQIEHRAKLDGARTPFVAVPALGTFVDQILVMDDGRVLASGGRVVVRYLASGQLDDEFGDGGVMLVGESSEVHARWLAVGDGVGYVAHGTDPYVLDHITKFVNE